MITSLQNFFLKHNKWLFGGLLVVIIVTFVLTIGPQSFFGSGGGQQRQALKFYGYDLSSESDQRAMAFTAEVSAILHPELQIRREQLMDYAYLRVAALGIASQIGIPNPTKEELSAYIGTLMVFANPQTGEFSAESYNRMMEALQNNARFDRESIGLVLREDYRIQKVREALGGPGYALPFEIKQDYIDRETRYTVSLARFAFADFNPGIDPTEEELRQYFNENPSRYEIPETLKTTALLFKGEAYLDEVEEPTEVELQAYFTTNRSRYETAREETGEAGTTEQPELTFAEVRDEVRADWIEQEARKIAAKKGEQFSIRLWQEGIALGSPEYVSLLENFEVETLDLPAYSRNQPPRIEGVPAQLLNSMWVFASNPNRYFSDIAQNANGAVIVVKQALSESRMPEFEEVREAVAADYRREEKRRLFAEKGEELRDTIQSRLEDESFEAIAEELGLAVESLDTFEGNAVPQQLRQSTVWDQAQYLDAGEISRMVISGDQGTLAYVAEKEVPEVDTGSEDYQDFVAQRTGFFNDALGWARLREITDTSLSSLLGTSPIE